MAALAREIELLHDHHHAAPRAAAGRSFVSPVTLCADHANHDHEPILMHEPPSVHARRAGSGAPSPLGGGRGKGDAPASGGEGGDDGDGDASPGMAALAAYQRRWGLGNSTGLQSPPLARPIPLPQPPRRPVLTLFGGSGSSSISSNGGGASGTSGTGSVSQDPDYGPGHRAGVIEAPLSDGCVGIDGSGDGSSSGRPTTPPAVGMPRRPPPPRLFPNSAAPPPFDEPLVPPPFGAVEEAEARDEARLVEAAKMAAAMAAAAGGGGDCSSSNVGDGHGDGLILRLVYDSLLLPPPEPRQQQQQQQGEATDTTNASSIANNSSESTSSTSSSSSSEQPCFAYCAGLEPWYTPTGPADDTLVFESRFESGNLRRAVQVRAREYDLVLAPDVNTRGHTQWFFFAFTNARAGATYRFNLINLAKDGSLHNGGLLPLVHSERRLREHGIGWARAGKSVAYYPGRVRRRRGGGVYSTLTFELMVVYGSEDVVHLAHCYPFTATDARRHIASVALRAAALPHGPVLARAPLCASLAGNAVDLLTITAAVDDPAAVPYARRRGVVLSARVHPGETNASWMMKGALDFLVSPCAEAAALRRRFVFKVVPMLNPDGVAVGNHRCGLAGLDLNRCWQAPGRAAPTVAALKALLAAFSREREVALFCDFHGHSRRRGVFAYGCEPGSGSGSGGSRHAFSSGSSGIRRAAGGHHLDQQQQPSSSSSPSSATAAGPPAPGSLGGRPGVPPEAAPRLLPLLLALVAPDEFAYRGCSYAVQRSKAGTGRVVAHRELGLANAVTLEASFAGPAAGTRRAGMHFNTMHLERVGAAVVRAVAHYCAPSEPAADGAAGGSAAAAAAAAEDGVGGGAIAELVRALTQSVGANGRKPTVSIVQTERGLELVPCGDGGGDSSGDGGGDDDRPTDSDDESSSSSSSSSDDDGKGRGAAAARKGKKPPAPAWAGAGAASAAALASALRAGGSAATNGGGEAAARCDIPAGEVARAAAALVAAAQQRGRSSDGAMACPVAPSEDAAAATSAVDSVAAQLAATYCEYLAAVPSGAARAALPGEQQAQDATSSPEQRQVPTSSDGSSSGGDSSVAPATPAQEAPASPEALEPILLQLVNAMQECGSSSDSGGGGGGEPAVDGESGPKARQQLPPQLAQFFFGSSNSSSGSSGESDSDGKDGDKADGNAATNSSNAPAAAAAVPVPSSAAAQPPRKEAKPKKPRGAKKRGKKMPRSWGSPAVLRAQRERADAGLAAALPALAACRDDDDGGAGACDALPPPLPPAPPPSQQQRQQRAGVRFVPALDETSSDAGAATSTAGLDASSHQQLAAKQRGAGDAALLAHGPHANG